MIINGYLHKNIVKSSVANAMINDPIAFEITARIVIAVSPVTFLSKGTPGHDPRPPNPYRTKKKHPVLTAFQNRGPFCKNNTNVLSCPCCTKIYT